MASPYDKLVELIKQLDINDDGIAMNHKIKSIEQDFYDIIINEQMLNESMEYMNDAVLKDKGSTAQKFALLISSRNFDFFTMNKTTIRYKMISLLQKNFLNADEFRKNNNRNMLYNSITLLGEYYNRVRQSDGSIMSNLGAAVIEMLTQEISNEKCEETEIIDVKLAKLILSQITLNGKLFQTAHKDELNILLYHIRRVLIELQNLEPCVKALLLMTLDLFYNNFCSLGTKLEDMYTKHLIDAENYDDDDNENNKIQILEQDINHLKIDEENQQQQNDITPNNCVLSENKRWSEQVYEEDLNENQSPPNGYCDTGSHSSTASIYNSHFNNSSSDLYFNDDRQSVRSEGGSLKLYNVKDRLRTMHRNYHHHQNHQNRSLGKLNNQHGSSTWNGRYRSYDRNRGNSRNNSSSANNFNNNDNNSHFNSNSYRNSYNNHHRSQYDRPPRFNKYQQQQNSNQEYNNSWRTQERQGGAGQNSNNYNRQNTREITDGDENRRESEPMMPQSRNTQYLNKTFVRCPRNQRENSFERNNYNPATAADSNKNFNRGSSGNLRRNSHNSVGGGRGGEGGGGNYRHYRNWNSGRYGSQNSLASDTAGGAWERRNRRGFSSRNNHYQDHFRNNEDRSSLNAIE